MFDFITMGVPMVVSTTRSVTETFPPGCFESFVSDDPSDLARAIQRLYEDPKLAMSYATRVKEIARPYSWPVQRERYWEVVDALLDPIQSDEVCDCGESLSVTLTSRPDAAMLARWDELVDNVPGGDVNQLSAWSDIRRAAGFQPLYLLARRGDELVGGALVLWRKLPLIGAVGYVPYGPLISPETDRTPAIAALAAALRRLAHAKMRMLFVQPPLDGEDISRELRLRGFRRSHAGIAPEASLRLDLARDEDDLRAGLSPDLRRRAKKWPTFGVRVRRGTKDDLPLFARLHAASAQSQGFEPIPLDYIATLYRRLAPTGHAELFIGELEGKPVVADLLTGCGGAFKLRLTGMDRDSEAGRAGVPAAVRWEAIRWAKANGYKWFDFGGIRDTSISTLVDKPPKSSPLPGDDAYKASFGGMPFRYATPVEMVSSPGVRVAYDLSLRWPVGRRLVTRASHHLLRVGRLSRRVVPIS
jgi:lipid II:glycine glycyltransferase (peptidoglycan interpeptide bridge formation enzyme)